MNESSPLLEPPGHGLPKLELFIGKILFYLKKIRTSDEAALKKYVQEGEIITSLFAQVPAEKISTQVLIPRIQGIEDSSRNWSPAMVLSHLCIVEKGILQLIEILESGKNSSHKVDIAKVKPPLSAGIEVVEDFRAMTEIYGTTIQSKMPLKSAGTHRHPWFGELNAHGWHCLAAVHRAIHRRQLSNILSLAKGIRR